MGRGAIVTFGVLASAVAGPVAAQTVDTLALESHARFLRRALAGSRGHP